MLRSISFGFLKPDALEDGVENIIFQRIRDAGLVIVATKRALLTADQIDTIYLRHRKDFFFADMKKYLEGREIVVFIVGSETIDAVETLDRVKGHTLFPGTIRGDLSRKVHWYSKEEIELWVRGKHPHQEQVSIEIMMINRLHSADNEVEIVRDIWQFFNIEELAEIFQEFPGLKGLVAS